MTLIPIQHNVHTIRILHALCMALFLIQHDRQFKYSYTQGFDDNYVVPEEEGTKRLFGRYADNLVH